MTQREADMKVLEDLVDCHTMSSVLCMLSEIAALKEQHVATYWQDQSLAREWRKAELALDRLHVKTTV